MPDITTQAFSAYLSVLLIRVQICKTRRWLLAGRFLVFTEERDFSFLVWRSRSSLVLSLTAN